MSPASNTTEYDAVIIGGGHNALVCAGYLARAGLKVAVAERRAIVGGACVTEEFFPGFRNSSCAYLVGLLAPEVIRDLELHRHGLEILERQGGTFSPAPDGSHIELLADKAAVKAQLSPADAAAYDELAAQLDRAATVMRAIAREPAPDISGGWGSMWRAARSGWHLRHLPAGDRADFAALMLKSLGDFLDERFDNAAFKGVYGFKGLVGNMANPYVTGSAYVLLHHVFGEVNGKRGKWGQPRGGMGAITQALQKSLESRGGRVLTGAGVREVIVENGVENGRARGIVLENGHTLRARMVVSGINPRLLFLNLVDTALLEPRFRRRIEAWRCRSGTFRMNVALSELPDFAARPGTAMQRHHQGTITIAPSLAYLERAHDDARHKGWSDAPVISMCIPTTIDPDLAPEGCHIAGLFCQHFNPVLPDGGNWHDHRDTVARHIIETIGQYAPNFPGAVLGYKALSPLDLEQEYGLVGGDIFHGEMHLDQLFSLRPAAEAADYTTPIRGLFQCASGTHPGGGVTGLPGWNAARAILGQNRRLA
ncbi:MAG: all-trans-retinol 13,14-reductase [Rhodobacteraceae bacterium HLUCCA12]|nr:MAG: all-trans-retinol 13,14-reductase [Rhodobacteraceae bacterium HLUCCA12]